MWSALVRSGVATLGSGVFLAGVALPGTAAASGADPTLPPHARPPIVYSSVPAPAPQGAKQGKGPGGGGGSGTASAPYSPSVIRTAYSISPGGSGKTIAIVDAYGDPNIAKDLVNFDTQWGISSATLNVTNVDGSSGQRNSNWGIETALDVEWAHASAPGAVIDLFITPDSSFQHLLDAVSAAEAQSPTAISMSWGAPESDYYGATSQCTVPGTQTSENCGTAYETVFQKAAGGTVLLAASGDQGSTDGTCCNTVDYPAASPEVVGVGGTTLTLNTNDTWQSETAWSGSGGGYSAIYPTPWWQPSSFTGRGVPDVAFDANPNTGVYVLYGGRWYEVGGTSVGAPNWAAIEASGKTAGDASLYSSTYYPFDYHDITQGSNGGYSATSGWDPVTGNGSPKTASAF